MGVVNELESRRLAPCGDDGDANDKGLQVARPSFTGFRRHHLHFGTLGLVVGPATGSYVDVLVCQSSKLPEAGATRADAFYLSNKLFVVLYSVLSLAHIHSPCARCMCTLLPGGRRRVKISCLSFFSTFRQRIAHKTNRLTFPHCANILPLVAPGLRQQAPLLYSTALYMRASVQYARVDRPFLVGNLYLSFVAGHFLHDDCHTRNFISYLLFTISSKCTSSSNILTSITDELCHDF